MQPAKQQRSKATQSRILKATESLLRNELFDEISIRRIVREAETSIGSFYARFRDKDALLHALYAKYEARLDRRLAVLSETVADVKSLDAMSRLIADHFVEIHGEIPNLSRAVFEYVTRAPDSDHARQHSAKRIKQYTFLIDSLLRFSDQITHPEPRRAIELALYFLTVACRNRLFYPYNPQTRTIQISPDGLKTELARMFVGYLQA